MFFIFKQYKDGSIELEVQLTAKKVLESVNKECLNCIDAKQQSLILELDEVHHVKLDLITKLDEYGQPEFTRFFIVNISTREVIMDTFRDEDFNDCDLTEDDREEIFIGILKGSSDLTEELFQSVMNNYAAGNIRDLIHEKPVSYVAALREIG